MKMSMLVPVVFALVICSINSPAQGPLTPSGAPGETMKSLGQVEPRIPIGSAPHTITHAGSYYLTTNLNGLLTIAADNVTLDLMGFQISSSGNAVQQSGSRTNILIRNGILSGVAANGIDFSVSGPGANGIIEDLRITDCGSYGLAVGGGYTVRRCHVSDTTLAGIRVYGNSRILDNTVVRCGRGLQLSSVNALVEGNVVKGNADNYNFAAGNQLNLLLCEIPENLDWPCSVKLAGSLTCPVTGTNGITVNADDVTIDLAGHTLIGPGADSGYGIYQDEDYRNLRVFNGKVTQWLGDFMVGVLADGNSSIISDLQSYTNYNGIFAGHNSSVSDCKVEGCHFTGIHVDSGSSVTRCSVRRNGGDGINGVGGSVFSDCLASYSRNGLDVGSESVLRNCTAESNSELGIRASSGCVVEGCAATANDLGGIRVFTGSSLSGCSARNNGGIGFIADYGCTLSDSSANGNDAHGFRIMNGSSIFDCVAMYNASNGIVAASGSLVMSCTADNNGDGGDGAGIALNGYDNRVEGCNCAANDRGIEVRDAGNFIVRNTCSGNTLNWDIVANNKVGTIVSAPNSGAISGNTGGLGVGSTDPWANFTY